MNKKKFNHKQIVSLWEPVYPKHRGFGDIAKEVGCSKALVAKIINEYLKQRKEKK